MQKFKKILLSVFAIFLLIVIICIATILLQKPSKYPFAKIDLETYFDEYLPDYSVSKTGLIMDVDAMVKYTDRLHADPYRMISKEDFLRKSKLKLIHLKKEIFLPLMHFITYRN